MDAKLERLVRERANDRCEYCQMPQQYSSLTLHIEHIIAQKHHGPTAPDNLALACLHCNLHKGSNLTGIDPVSKQIVRLFNPRVDTWRDHFEWRGPELTGRTPIGRGTVDVLVINHPDYVAARAGLISEGRFPPRP